MTYAFLDKPQESNTDILVAAALNGEIYFENGRLHVKNDHMHFIYKPDGSQIGWYARNPKTLDDVFLGIGACPTAEFENLNIVNKPVWESIVVKDKE